MKLNSDFIFDENQKIKKIRKSSPVGSLNNSNNKSLNQKNNLSKNDCESFQSRKVCLMWHKSNKKNFNLVNERLNREYDIYSRNHRPNHSLNEIIRDISMLKTNNNLTKFSSDLKSL